MAKTFDQEYKYLLSYGRRLLFDYPQSILQPEDLINEAYLQTFDEKFDVRDFKKVMCSYILKEVHSRDNISLLDRKKKKEDSLSVCTKCKEEYPSYFFHLKNDRKTSTCLPCFRKYMREYYKKRYVIGYEDVKKKKPQRVWSFEKKKQQKALTEIWKKVKVQESWKKASKKYHKKPEIREQQRARMREYNRKQKDNLTDIYIKQLLRGLGYKTKDITPEMIAKKRNQILGTTNKKVA